MGKVILYFILMGLAAASGWAGQGSSVQDRDWGRFTTPAQGVPEAIGFYSDGCMRGGTALPFDPETQVNLGYQVTRKGRNRFYGHQELLDHLSELSQKTQGLEGQGVLLIGDMSHIRGGKMPSGHKSHRVGLDVDVWFWQPETPLSREEAERVLMSDHSMVRFENEVGSVDLSVWKTRYADTLKLAGQDFRTARIFVNRAIRKYLCETWTFEERVGWFHKIRIENGHDEHFHTRLRCPEGSPMCITQPGPDPRDLCSGDPDLLRDWQWFLLGQAPSLLFGYTGGGQEPGQDRDSQHSAEGSLVDPQSEDFDMAEDLQIDSPAFEELFDSTTTLQSSAEHAFTLGNAGQQQLEPSDAVIERACSAVYTAR